MLKRILLFLTTFILVFAFLSCDLLTADNEKTEKYDYSADSDIENINLYVSAQHLDIYKKGIYNHILADLSSYSTALTFTDIDIDTDELLEIYVAVLYDHPELFWVGSGYSYTETTGSDSVTIEITPAINDSKETIAEKQAALDAVVLPVIEAANTYQTDYEKALYLHDYIINSVEYDEETAAFVGARSNTNVIFESATSYGALVGHKAICSGYAAAYQYLVQKTGIRCGRVSGVTSSSDSGHEWNYVYLDGEYYYVDVTWDDPSLSGEAVGTDKNSYIYFCIGADDLKLTHTFYEDQFVPESTGTKYNYYVYNGYTLDKYDFGSVSDIVAKQFESGQAEIRFSNADECFTAEIELFDNQRIFNVPVLSSRNKISHYTSDSGLVLIIMFN